MAWMKINSKHVVGTALLFALLLASGCGSDPAGQGGQSVDPPRGYVDQLQVVIDGQTFLLGPFIGYYLAPVSPDDLSRLRFICYNERSWYTSELPAGTKLFTGTAKLTSLPVTAPGHLPGSDNQRRITPVYPEDQPLAWSNTRPGPGWLHFHSLHNDSGAVRHGYWLQHYGLKEFTYDMGGRVGNSSILHHAVQPGLDMAFAPLIEFDKGPANQSKEMLH